jgi:hypothetical protein
MRNIAVIASLICCLILPDMAFAMPVATGDTVAKATNAEIIQARGGCGRWGRAAAAGGAAKYANEDPSGRADGFPASGVQIPPAEEQNRRFRALLLAARAAAKPA